MVIVQSTFFELCIPFIVWVFTIYSDQTSHSGSFASQVFNVQILKNKHLYTISIPSFSSVCRTDRGHYVFHLAVRFKGDTMGNVHVVWL